MKEAHENLAGAESSSRKEGGRILRALSEKEQVALLVRLNVYAARRYRGLLSSEDLVMEAWTAVLAERRTWDSDYPPFDNLCWIIRSIADKHLRRELRAVPLGYSDGCLPDASTPVLYSLPTQLSPASQYEASEELRNRLEQLRHVSKVDNSLRRMVMAAFEINGWKPRDLAEALGWSVSAVNNAKRRIKRILLRLRNR
jgi:DNA-directed RNA polymerase specialized sigma24 family protein